MSDALLDLDPDGNAAQAQRIAANTRDATPEASVMQGFGRGVGMRTMRGLAGVARTVGVLSTAPVVAAENLLGVADEKRPSNELFSDIDNVLNSAVDYWTPKAGEVGKAGEIVGGLAEGLVPLALGPAGVPAMLGNAQVGTALDLVRDQGVDAKTANEVGFVAGAANAVGFKIPFLGQTLATRITSGIGGNLAANTAAAVAQNTTLKYSGNAEAAKQFDPTNPEARALDILMGAAFGTVAHVSAPRPLLSQGDAVLATRNAKNFQQDSAPGVPKDATSSAAHQQAMEQAMLQLMRGEKVDIAATIKDADFLTPPQKETPAAVAVREAVADMRPTPGLPQSGARGIRNNNPGNIDKSSTPWQGKIEGSDPRFETFATPELGIRALAKNLLTYQERHGKNTVTDIISRWAPSVENNTGAYVDAVAKKIGVGPTEAVNLRDPATLQKLTTAIIEHENGKHPYTPDTIRGGVDLALSGRSATTPEQIAKTIPKAKSLPAEQRTIESNLTQKIAGNFEGAKKEYAKLPESDGGRIINTDIARELSPEYAANRTLSAAVHEPASWFTKEYYADRLAQLPKNSDVLFTAGGTGAGKTSALETIPEMKQASQNAGLVFDTNMNGLKSSIQKIEQALDAGHNVKVVMVDRDPVEALVKGALPRAMSKGRTVPLNEHFKTHRDVRGVMQQLQTMYADNPKFSLSVVDNSLGKGNAVLTQLDKLPLRDHNVIERQLQNALENEYQNGRIPDNIYRGTLPTGPLGSVHPQGVPSGLPESNGSANRYPDGSREGNRNGGMESPNGRSNAQADTGAAAELLRGTQGGEGNDAQGRGIRPSVSETAFPELAEINRFLSESGLQLSPEVTQALGKLTEPAPKSADTNQAKLPATPEVSAMQKIVESNPDAVVLDGYDADGAPKYTSMREAVARIEAEHTELVKETKSYEAAVNCLLRRGG